MTQFNFRKSLFHISLFTFLLLLIAKSSNAQEQLLPLGSNQVLIDAAKKAFQVNGNLRTSTFNDTLVLPFVDDFSRPGIYPFTELWMDSNVYINTNYGDLPTTIGVATFDGLNQYGRPYNPAATADSIADVLTSRPIDLGAVMGDTSVWLSFFYQPQGLGDIPESKDSLQLQFRDTGGVWNTVWSLPGKADTVFQRANLHVLDPIYFYKGFQFRFYNIATVNGNRDHWNIDYVILRRFASVNDSILDNALVFPQTSLLTEFTAMPYPHYKFLGAQIPASMKTQLNDTIYDINYGSTTYFPQMEISQNGAVLFNGNTGSISSPSSLTYNPYSIPLGGFTYPVQGIDSTDFLVKSFFSQSGFQSNVNNDTSFFTQHFHSYYAYDDGSAEVAYGLVGNQDISLAYKFDVKMRDTLVGAQIYFNPVGIDVTNKLFHLVAWSAVNVGSNSDTRIHTTYDFKPGTNDSINGFKTFVFDSLLIVDAGEMYIGIEQSEPALQYGVGLDRNTDSRNKMFYHLDGFWHQSNIKGSWMIRPIFGRHISTIGIDDVAQSNFDFKLYPNPAQNEVIIQLPFEENATYQILNLIGETISAGEISGSKKLNIEDLSSGIYFVRIINKNKFNSVKKLMID